MIKMVEKFTQIGGSNLASGSMGLSLSVYIISLQPPLPEQQLYDVTATLIKADADVDESY